MLSGQTPLKRPFKLTITWINSWLLNYPECRSCSIGSPDDLARSLSLRGALAPVGDSLLGAEQILLPSPRVDLGEGRDQRRQVPNRQAEDQALLHFAGRITVQ